ncbi:MAG: secondary thiamine-phosphate synthase enzyme YjbQ [Thermodesulfobacteriota bacterium]
MEKLSVKTSRREEMANLTAEVQRLVADKGWGDGLLYLWCPHTTGALTVNEAADPDVVRDMVASLARLAPPRGDNRHAEGNTDAHIKSSLMGPGLTLIVADGRVQLGTWQGVFFCEWDGPRSRQVWATFLTAK